MSNKLSKYQSSKVLNTRKLNQSKFEDLSQSKFDEYICQSCEERQLQIEYAPSEWLIETFDKKDTVFVCDNRLCKWFKN